LINHSVVLSYDAIPVQVWTGSDSSRKLRLPKFIGNQHMKVVGLSALLNGCLYPPGNTPGQPAGLGQ